MSESQHYIDERAPLLSQPSPTVETNKRVANLLSVTTQAGVVLFVVLVWSVLLTTPWSLFSYHPASMTVLVVGATEGMSDKTGGIIPTYTAPEKKKGLRRHAFLQALAYTSAILGFTAITHNKALHDKPHITSVHAHFGVFTFSFLFIQLLFGIVIAYAPSVVGGTPQAKSLWKYHRISGYVLLVLIWATAQLGAHAEFMVDNFPKPKLLWLYWVSLVLVSIGIAKRTDVSKWGVKRQRS
ncbi:hypothetical protein INT43_005936 [Umbelopsis isabellina]|uniref:Cytochrome b561 domain-containing protein n=1 Tax=Mortierella isabellina TaxID=91625 RepID=A0A8H7PJX5_MORIS|nr:hypothetical protein INT43_005936 [Umbelopsis isabellina]